VKRWIGVLPEEILLYERLTPLECVHLSGSLYGLNHADIQKRSSEIFDLLELSAHERGRMIVDFSMGMRKKVALACALLHGPKLLFLDEPFNGIDAVTTRAIKHALLEATGRGVTVFFSSHILEQVERLCTRIGIIQDGKLRTLGTLAEIRESSGAPPDATLEDVFVRIVGGDRVLKGRLDFLG
jgi:ABC-2 type transport system ATP-binding protein